MDQIIEQAELAPLTTLRIGGAAKRLWTVDSEDDCVAALRQLGEADDQPLLILAGGSNLVIADDGFDGTVLRLAFEGLRKEQLADGRVAVELAAGTPWDALVDELVGEGLSGVECLAGIPGSAGATPIQNVGAYGQEVASVIESVRAYRRSSGEVEQLSAAQCGFGYRSSALKRDSDLVVLSVRMLLERSPLSAPIGYSQLAAKLGVELGQRAELAAAREAVLELRRAKAMVLDGADHDTWSVGSFFTNPIFSGEQFALLEQRVREHCGADAQAPRFDAGDGAVKSSAAWLIEQAGFSRGERRGNVAISSKHTLALTNRGGASAAELLDFAHQIADRVEQLFGVSLNPEPALVGLSW